MNQDYVTMSMMSNEQKSTISGHATAVVELETYEQVRLVCSHWFCYEDTFS